MQTFHGGGCKLVATAYLERLRAITDPVPPGGKQSQMPFLGQQNTQKQIMEIKNVIMGLNQKMIDLEKATMHM